MARKMRKESDCYSCGECIGCGRDHLYDYEYLECDKCGDEVETLYVYEGKELCYDCLMDNIEIIEL